jgi:hypothetical protein
MTHRPHPRLRKAEQMAGFTLIEMLIGSTLMLVVIIAALSIYSKSNKVAVDQQQYAEIQHDVRTSMFLISRDIRMAGAGLPEEFSMYSLEGVDNENQGRPVTPDRLRILGNIDDPLNLRISNYQGSAANLAVDDYSFEQYPYPDGYYVNKYALVLPNPASVCRSAEVRVITSVTHNTGGTNEKLNFSPGLAPGVNPPGGLSGTCTDSNSYDGGLVLFADVREYWLDLTGATSGLTAGVNGYIGGTGGVGVLYMTKNGVHFPLAQNIENIQFEYNGDLSPEDGTMDGFQPWSNAWYANLDLIGRIRQVRILILGCTPNRFISVSGRPPANIYNYRRPGLSNTPAATTDDMRRRFLLESMSNIRNLSLKIYNTGER